MLIPRAGYCQAGAEDWQITRLDMQAGLSDNCVNDVLMDSRHFLWIGTNAGLDLYDGCNIAQVAFAGVSSATVPVVFTLAEDLSGTIWAGTSEGLYHIDRDHLEISFQ